MEKKKYRIILKSSEDNYNFCVIGNNDNNIITYNEKLNIVTNVIFDINNLILKRENKDLFMNYNFKSKKGNIYIKELNKELNIDIEIIKIEKSNNKIQIEYKIDNDKFIYSIMEV